MQYFSHKQKAGVTMRDKCSYFQKRSGRATPVATSRHCIDMTKNGRALVVCQLRCPFAASTNNRRHAREPGRPYCPFRRRIGVARGSAMGQVHPRG